MNVCLKSDIIMDTPEVANSALNETSQHGCAFFSVKFMTH